MNCVICGQPIGEGRKCGAPAREAKYCAKCRADRRRRAKLKYTWRPEFDAFLKAQYYGGLNRRFRVLNRMVRLTGVPRWYIKRQAARLGLTMKMDRKPWTRAELKVIEKLVGRVSSATIAKRVPCFSCAVATSESSRATITEIVWIFLILNSVDFQTDLSNFPRLTSAFPAAAFCRTVPSFQSLRSASSPGIYVPKRALAPIPESSATVTLPDYGKVARHSGGTGRDGRDGGTARNVAKSPDVCPRMFARGLGYSYRSATMGSTRMARRAGM
jgi:hypothetical protein